MAAAARVVDTSAWIEWLTGSALGQKLGKQFPDRELASYPPSCSWNCPSGWYERWVENRPTR